MLKMLVNPKIKIPPQCANTGTGHRVDNFGRSSALYFSIPKN